MKRDSRAFRPVVVRNLAIGEGMPKICVPVVGSTREEVFEEIAMVPGSNADIVEWRADFLGGLTAETACGILAEIRREVDDMPFLFTCRGEGGKAGLEADAYAELLLAVIGSGHADMVDIELAAGDRRVRKLADAAHKAGLAVIVSHHDSIRTPPAEDLLRLFRRMRDCGADIPKLAVMPHSFNDILTLLAVTDEFAGDAACPLISMSMSNVGSVGRLLGEVCGSSITFGGLRRGGEENGPLAVDDLRTILDILHKRG